MAFDNILVVCIGNICRSPIAEALLKDQHPSKHIESAGIAALVGNPVDAKSQEVMIPYNIDMSNHVAKQINEQVVMTADLIFTMSEGQTRWIEERWPHCRGKTFRIGHWIDKDIADPHRHGKAAFETARADIMDSLVHWTDKIS